MTYHSHIDKLTYNFFRQYTAENYTKTNIRPSKQQILDSNSDFFRQFRFFLDNQQTIQIFSIQSTPSPLFNQLKHEVMSHKERDGKYGAW